MEISEEPHCSIADRDIKALVRHRDGYVCTDCGKTLEEQLKTRNRNLEVHRVNPGSDYTIAGCVTLCFDCHLTKPTRPMPKLKYTPERIQQLRELAVSSLQQTAGGR